MDFREFFTSLHAADKRCMVWVAAQCARHVLPKVPRNELRPLRAIEAAEAWVDNPCERTAIDAEWAANAASNVAASATSAAWSASDAGRASTNSSNAATWAATMAANKAAQASSPEEIETVINSCKFPLTAVRPKQFKDSLAVIWNTVAWDEAVLSATHLTVPQLLEAHKLCLELKFDWSNSSVRGLLERLALKGCPQELVSALQK